MSSICAGDTVAGRYLVERPIDLDPIFASYAASDQREGQEVLLLAVNPEILSSASDHQLFLRRVERALFLTVPGVAKVHRVTSDRGQTVIICEPVSGPSLRALIDYRRRGSDLLTPAGAISLLRAMAGILQAAAPDCAHGYLIPSNVFVEERGVRLVAFGLATALPAERATAAIAAEAAVRRYLAPEVLGGRLAEPGSDVYSLAVIASDLLGARRPRELLGRVLASSLEERPSDLPAFVDELEQALLASASSAPAPSDDSADSLDEPTRAERKPATARRARAVTLKDEPSPLASAAEPVTLDAQGGPKAPLFTETTAVDLAADARAKDSLEARDRAAEAPPRGKRWISNTIRMPAISPPGSVEETTWEMDEHDALHELDPRLVQAALILDSARGDALDSCPDRETMPQPAPPGADAEGARSAGSTLADQPILQAPIITLSSPKSTPAAAERPEPAPQAPSTATAQEPAPARPQVPPEAKQTWVRDTVKLSTADVPAWMQSMEKAAATHDAGAAGAEAAPQAEPAPPAEAVREAATEPDREVEAPSSQAALPEPARPAAAVAPETGLARSPTREQLGPPRDAVKPAPATSRDSRPLVKPTSDTWSWGLLLALVGGLLLVVYLVAFVAVSLME